MRQKASEEEAKEIGGVKLQREIGQQKRQRAEGQQRLQSAVKGLDCLRLGQVDQSRERVQLSGW